jgi:hypothetical protein
MATFKQAAKSKTLNFNVFMPIIIMVSMHFGIPLTPEIVMAIMTLGNIILRFVTKKPLNEK